jgi:hypothetical protein
MARLLAFALLLLPSSAFAVDVPDWLADRADDARWLAEKPGEPRAILVMEEGFAQVVLYVPQISADDIVNTVVNYDVYKRTEAVESAFESDGHFFTATRMLGQFSPTITDYTIKRNGGALEFSWSHIKKEQAIPWLRERSHKVEKALALAGIDRETDEYIDEVEKRYHVIADVVGHHMYENGFYRYSQQATTKSRFAQGLVDGLGKSMQVAAALKAACYSIGIYDWAGPSGEKGPEFEARGNMGSSMRPSK